MDARKAIEFVSQALAPAGVLAYAIVYLWYDRFYGGLGLSPSDLGLDFATVLARSVSLFCAIAYNSALSTLVIYFAARMLIRSKKMEVPRSAVFLRSLQVSLLFWLVTIFIGMLSFIDLAISDIRSGKVVIPIFHKQTGVTLFPIRADAVEVTRLGSADAASGLPDLESRELLYLGSDNGDPASAWFYDSKTQSSIRAPLTSLVLEVVNCTEDDSPNARCQSVYGRDDN